MPRALVGGEIGITPGCYPGITGSNPVLPAKVGLAVGLDSGRTRGAAMRAPIAPTGALWSGRYNEALTTVVRYCRNPY